MQSLLCTHDLLDSIDTTGGLLDPGSNLLASSAIVETKEAFVSLAAPSADNNSPWESTTANPDTFDNLSIERQV